ncbi:MAG: hypothetical protein ACKOEM_20530 [Planctomycetia bacterium]
MNRVVLCVALAVAFFTFRMTQQPAAPVAPAAVVVPALAKYRSQMSVEDRTALAQCYEILAKSVAANPVDDPVIPSVAALNDVHRAALLFVWRGVLGNQPGKYEGLREELEGLVKDAIGESDVPLNPAVQKDAATLFGNIALSLR